MCLFSVLTCSSSYILTTSAVWPAADGLRSLPLGPLEMDESSAHSRKSYQMSSSLKQPTYPGTWPQMASDVGFRRFTTSVHQICQLENRSSTKRHVRTMMNHRASSVVNSLSTVLNGGRLQISRTSSERSKLSSSTNFSSVSASNRKRHRPAPTTGRFDKLPPNPAP